MQRDFGILKDRPNRYGELAPAFAALVEAVATVPGGAFLAVHFRRVVMSTAVRADRAVRPQLRLQIFPGGLFGLVWRGGQPQ